MTRQLSLDKKVINDQQTLQTLKSVTFTKTDLRAGWIGPGIPETKVKEFLPIARWATHHLNMYLTFLQYMKKDSKDTAVLDVGCGIGHATITLATIYPKARLTAIDNDPEAITFAETYNKSSNIKYITENFFDFNTDERFDYIFALEILEHLPALLHYIFIDKCLSLLSENGKLFITTPNEPDQKDASYGHIGFLNRKRAEVFFIRYKDNIEAGSFINNQKLLDRRLNASVVDAPLSTFTKNPEIKSHFRIVMIKKTDNNQSKSKSTVKNDYYIRYTISNIILSYRRVKEKILIYSKKAVSIKSYKNFISRRLLRA